MVAPTRRPRTIGITHQEGHVSEFANELLAQRELTVQLIRAAARTGDDMLLEALTGRLEDLGDIAVRHGLPA